MKRLAWLGLASSLIAVGCDGKRTPENDEFCNAANSHAFAYEDDAKAEEAGCLKMTIDDGRGSKTVFCCPK